MTAPANGSKSVDKSNGNLTPFKPGPHPNRGRGPKKGAPNAGRPPDWLKAEMARGRTLAVGHLVKAVDRETPELDPDQMLKLVKEWAPPGDAASGVQVTIHKDGSVTIDSPGSG